MKNWKFITLIGLVGVVALGLPQAAKADVIVGSVVADYSVTSGDNTTLQFTNNSSAAFTNVTLTGAGYSGSVNGLTSTTNLGNIAAGSTLVFSFTDAGGIFSNDFDDWNSGNVQYTFSATMNGTAVTAVFSPDNNLSGGFVGFLGNGQNGFETDNQTGPTTVANITAVPEPASLLVFGLGTLGVLGYSRRRRVATI